MLFSSYEFVLFFLPAALIAYHICNRRSASAGNACLMVLSLLFIAWQGILHAIIVLCSAAINYALYRKLCCTASEPAKKTLLTAGILINVCLLCVFKYGTALRSGFLPLGISFYTFQQIAFLVEAWRGGVEMIHPTEYLLFVTFFPKAVQGPIPTATEFFPPHNDHRSSGICSDRLAKGVYLFALGLAKKVLIADHFSIIADFGFRSISGLNSFEALLTIFAYTFQLYFDFSGYSDMAVAVGMMFGFELPDNFDSPYKARNISDFWRRWHITLSRFLTRYIYIPLGGNRRGTLRTFANIMAVYLVSGLWHGTGTNFLFWGILHGAASIAYRIFRKPYDRLPGCIQWLCTFVFINFTWIFFRAPSVAQGFALISQLFVGGWDMQLNAELVEYLQQPTFISAGARLIGINAAVILGTLAALLTVVFAKNSAQHLRSFRPGAASLFVTYLLLLLCILSFAGTTGFLYTNF